MATRRRPQAEDLGPDDDGEDVPVSVRDVVEILAGDRPSYEAGFVDGYKAGFAAGWDVGAGAALEDHDKHWQQLARWYVQHTCPGQYDPRQPRGAAYEEALRRRGGREYAGGPVHWYTGRPARDRGAA